jgi:uncharacterized protein (DUF488 family)
MFTGMSSEKPMTIWTIGHSTRTYDEFCLLLKQFDINLLVDVRAFPGSRRYPHFNRSELQVALQRDGIDYLHMPALGGRRKPLANSPNGVWRNESFRGYADYMDTDEFKSAIATLEQLASTVRVAYMCSESVWWKCHRGLISDSLKLRKWNVIHILEKGKTQEHPFTPPLRAVQGKILYNN